MSFADGAKGRCPLDSRSFFEKKLIQSFISPAGGTRASPLPHRFLMKPPAYCICKH